MEHLYSPARKSDFPIFSRVINGSPLVYLDSGATSQRPRSVLQAMYDHDAIHNGAVNRGSHTLAGESTLAFEKVRNDVAQFVGAFPDEIIWTSGSTMALNAIAYSCANASQGRYINEDSERFSLSASDTIVVTRAEHHANLVPWQELAARTGAILRWIDLDSEGYIDENTLDVIDERTKICAFTHVSNVSGVINDVDKIANIAHSVGALVVLDACQSVPHMSVDFHALDVDFAVFSGHKMLGPTGIGVLYGKRDLLASLPPFLTGGSMIETVEMESSTYDIPPARFEAGTQAVTQIIGLGEAVRYLNGIGMDVIHRHEQELTRYALEKMNDMEGIRILGPSRLHNRLGALAFDVDGVHPHDVGQFLDAKGVAVRTGHHCAQPLHRHLGVYASSRASFGPYNTLDDVDRFIEALAGVRSYFSVE
ncbi:MAG: SufS family cysteine desulfurase [Actinomycetaceae bacterium]|nr:SufS family cysteine desulfurase [Actinomycetaceae bacterium]